MGDLDWGTYFTAQSAFAGAVFALVLAARQIRGASGKIHDPSVRSYRLADSIAVTTELAASATLSYLVIISGSTVFQLLASATALTGLILSSRAGFLFLRARPRLSARTWRQDAEGIGNLIPIASYAIMLLYGFGVFPLTGAWLQFYALVTAWLLFSGCFQAIFWYARVWKHDATP